MANFIVSYDLNGPKPSHAEMDKHLEKIGAQRGRILETVWYVGATTDCVRLMNHIQQILGKEDLLFVCEADAAAWTKTLVCDSSLEKAFSLNGRR